MANREQAPCLDCGVAVPTAAVRCPHCDYAVTEHDRPRLLLGAVGMALSLTVVLAPLGVPLLWLARRHRLAAGGTVTRRETADPVDHLARVLGRHLGLVPTGELSRERSRSRGATSGSPDAIHDSR